MTPAEITKLTQQAARGRALMKQTSDLVERSTKVFDNYEATVATFSGHVERVDKEGAALQAMMSAMGNAGPILEAAFQDGEVAVSAKPEETAHIPTTEKAA